MYSCIFFDFDGTLYDTVEGITKSVRYALQKRGMDAELSALRCFAGPLLTDMFMEKFGLSLPEAEQAVRDFRERYVPIGLYESRAFPGMRAFLEALKAEGKRLAVSTSKPSPWRRSCCAGRGWTACSTVSAAPATRGRATPSGRCCSGR